MKLITCQHRHHTLALYTQTKTWMHHILTDMTLIDVGHLTVLVLVQNIVPT